MWCSSQSRFSSQAWGCFFYAFLEHHLAGGRWVKMLVSAYTDNSSKKQQQANKKQH